MKALPREFYMQETEAVARGLLGCLLVREVGGERLVVRINETEAYIGPDDPACHAYGGRRTTRTEVMFGPGGHAYVYFIYGMHYMLNVVTRPEGDPQAVLLRGACVVSGLDAIARRRFGKPHDALSRAQRRALLDGPGKLCKGLGLTKEHNGRDLCRGSLRICEGEPVAETQILVSKRIGIEYAGEAVDWPLRFYTKA